MDQQWLTVPVGRDAAGWRTVPTQRTALAVVHTMACVAHVLDAIEMIESDMRIQTVFTQPPDVFSGGVRDYLRAAGAVTVGWQQATQTDFDLVVAADCAGVHRLHGPLLALQHGVPNNKLAPPALGGPGSDLVVGLGAPWLTWYGRLLPTALALSHRDALAVLERQCPQALPVAEVVGDLSLDRLVASRAHRVRYRQALGFDDGRTVVGVSSTWGAQSLFGRAGDALLDALSDLPGDEFGVVLAVHPALFFGHGPRQVRSWLRRPGLRLVDPVTWRGMVAAADLIVGDHGSMTLYAAAAGVPVIRAGAPPPTPSGSAAEVLASVTRALRPDRPLAEQLRTAAGEAPPAAVGAAVTSRPDQAAGLLRAQMYRLLALPEPAEACVPAPVGLPILVDAHREGEW